MTTSCVGLEVRKPKNVKMRTYTLYIPYSDTARSLSIVDGRCSWNFLEKNLITENATKCVIIARKACTSLKRM